METFSIELATKSTKASLCSSCKLTIPRDEPSIFFKFWYKGIKLQARMCIFCGTNELNRLIVDFSSKLIQLKGKGKK